MKVKFSASDSPIYWAESISRSIDAKSGNVIAHHLVGATLQMRHRASAVPNFSGNAADAQTERAGDFVIGASVYHVTTAPGLALIRK